MRAPPRDAQPLPSPNIPFYRKKLDEAPALAPATSGATATSADLPFTTKIDLRDHYPFGMFARPRDQIVRVHASSGTTGNPPWLRATRSTHARATSSRAPLAAGGVKPGRPAAERLRLRALHRRPRPALRRRAPGLPQSCPSRVVTPSVSSRSCVPPRDRSWSCTPSYAMYLAEAAADRGLPPGRPAASRCSTAPRRGSRRAPASRRGADPCRAPPRPGRARMTACRRARWHRNRASA